MHNKFKTSTKQDIELFQGEFKDEIIVPPYNFSGSNGNYKIKDFFVKSSYNSAYNGKNMDVEMVKTVLNRGCRYLDFEIVKNDDKLYITYDNLALDKQITLDSVLLSINATLTKGDPVFINLRLRNPSSISYNTIVPTLRTLQSNLRYSGVAINSNTKMSQIRGKCIFISDSKITDGSGKSATDIVIDNPNTGFYSYKNTIIVDKNPTMENQTTQVTIVEPDTKTLFLLFDYDTINVRNLVLNYKANFTPHKFYMQGEDLNNYEYIFNDAKSTFIRRNYLDAKFFERMDSVVDSIE